jgi:hypothetical protein
MKTTSIFSYDALEEQVEQDEEALGGVLAAFVHRAGHVHDAEHHGRGRRLRDLDAVAVAQVDRVDEGIASSRVCR